MVTMLEPARFNLMAGWISMVAGALSGAAIGLFFHNEEWMGGYTSLRRRMIRLGHIAFFGLGILNVLYGLSLLAIPIPAGYAGFSCAGFFVSLVTMPACCFLTAWRAGSRYLFPIPVLGVLVGLGGLIGGWLAS
jgi:hypothetical protein